MIDFLQSAPALSTATVLSLAMQTVRQLDERIDNLEKKIEVLEMEKAELVAKNKTQQEEICWLERQIDNAPEVKHILYCVGDEE